MFDEKRLLLEQRYRDLCCTPSDINEHLPLLRTLSSQCDLVVELGMRHCVSTTALLAGQPKKLITVDINFSDVYNVLKDIRCDTTLEFSQGDSRNDHHVPDGVDLLFVDTLHRYDQIVTELHVHAAKVKRWIAFHDTISFGQHGEGGGIGILPAISEFLKENNTWAIAYHATNNNGLLVIERV